VSSVVSTTIVGATASETSGVPTAMAMSNVVGSLAAKRHEREVMPAMLPGA